MRVALLVWLATAACNATTTPPAPNKPPPRFASVAAAVARGDAPKTTSVVVLRGGRLEYEAYFDGATADTLHDTRSVGKSLTTLAVGIAIDRGVLPSVDAKAFAYLGDLRPFANDGAKKRAITIEDLLTMSSALDCDDNDDKSPGNEANMYPQAAWARWVVDLPTRKKYRRDAKQRGPWHYCTAGTFLLGQIIQRAANQPIDHFIAEQLFAPLGITRFEFAKSPAGEVMTGGSLRLRARDLAAIGEMVRTGGKHAATQVVPAEFVRSALTVRRSAFPAQKLDYGYLFWHRSFPTQCGAFPAWYMSGNGGNVIAIFDGLDAVVVVTRTNYNARRMHEQTAALIERHILPELACPR